MSQLSLFVKSGFVKAPLANGIGRYVPQCQRMTLKFCLGWGNSRGVRDFIQHDLIEFVKQNPGTVMYLKPRRHRSPVLVAEYLNGGREWMSLDCMERNEVYKWLDIHRTKAGYPDMHFKNYQHSDIPSIQGFWTPFTHKPADRAVLSYPQESLNTPLNLKPSTTEIVSKLYSEPQEQQSLS